MNGRIKELAEQAGAKFTVASKDYFGDTYPAGVLTDRVDLEKFAELIVLECIDRVRAQYIPVRDQLDRTEREQGIVECGVNSVIALEELVQESTDRWYKENILGCEK